MVIFTFSCVQLLSKLGLLKIKGKKRKKKRKKTSTNLLLLSKEVGVTRHFTFKLPRFLALECFEVFLAPHKTQFATSVKRWFCTPREMLWWVSEHSSFPWCQQQMGSPSKRLKACMISMDVKVLPPCSADVAFLLWQDPCLYWDNIIKFSVKWARRWHVFCRYLGVHTWAFKILSSAEMRTEIFLVLVFLASPCLRGLGWRPGSFYCEYFHCSATFCSDNNANNGLQPAKAV